MVIRIQRREFCTHVKRPSRLRDTVVTHNAELRPCGRPRVIPDGIDGVYRRIAPVYDSVYGVLLQPGRRRAMTSLAPGAGEHILEIGVGTGFNLTDYPDGCRVTGIDLSAPMIARAAARRRARGLTRVSLCRMDALRLAFPDQVFDAVYAPYVINVVPNPIAAAREMIRVCRPGGRLVFLNHFEGVRHSRGVTNRVSGALATWLTGVDWTLRLEGFLETTGLQAESIEAVNVPRVSTVLVCRC
jgi:phosphatidylethanolamine/phosphatidyl-N-methylethanolamine N-methyltransferase